MMVSRYQPRKRGAAQTQAAHVSGEQQSQGYSRGADDQLQQLEPDNLVDKRGAAAACEQQQPGKQIAIAALNRGAVRLHRLGLRRLPRGYWGASGHRLILAYGMGQVVILPHKKLERESRY